MQPLPECRGKLLSSQEKVGRLMRYRLEISEEALAQLRALPKEERRRIGRRFEALQTDLHGDVKKLASREGKYRLRTGPHRVLFTLEKDLLIVHEVRNRKDAYRN